jgi:uncharacterized membrane protein
MVALVFEGRRMKKKTFMVMIGLVTLVLGASAAVGTFILQLTLDHWKSLFYFSELGSGIWVLVPILYILSLLFVLTGFYMIYENGVLDKYLKQPNTEKEPEVQK